MARPNMDIALVVKTLLAYRGKEQADLAEYMQFTPGVISKALSPKHGRKWTADDIAAMADFFEVSNELLMRDPATLLNLSGSDLRAELRSELAELARLVAELSARVEEMGVAQTPGPPRSRRDVAGSR